MKQTHRSFTKQIVCPGIVVATLAGINALAADQPASSTTPRASVESARFVRALRAGRQQTIVTYGTSLTAGGAWVQGLQAALEEKYPGLATVINAGEGAKWSVWGLEHLEERVLDNKPDAVFIEFSVNDAYLPYRMSVEACGENLRTMIARILETNRDGQIILMVMNPMVNQHAANRPQLGAFNEVYRKVAREKGLMLIDHYPDWAKLLEADRKEFDRLVPDGAHPSAEGCRRIILPNILRAIGEAGGI